MDFWLVFMYTVLFVWSVCLVYNNRAVNNCKLHQIKHEIEGIYMAKNINGNGDGGNGENETYSIPGRGTVSRPKLVKEVESGKHPNHHVMKRDGKKYVRANPNNVGSDNVDK